MHFSWENCINEQYLEFRPPSECAAEALCEWKVMRKFTCEVYRVRVRVERSWMWKLRIFCDFFNLELKLVNFLLISQVIWRPRQRGKNIHTNPHIKCQSKTTICGSNHTTECNGNINAIRMDGLRWKKWQKREF